MNLAEALQPEAGALTPRLRLRYMLRQCEAAIDAIMSGAQSYNIAGQSLTRANLKDLMDWRAQLLKELALLDGPLRKVYRVRYLQG